MQTRLIFCLAGGVLGLLVPLTVGGNMGLSPLFAMLGFTAIGVVVGYVVSVFIDVFVARTGDESAQS